MSVITAWGMVWRNFWAWCWRSQCPQGSTLWCWSIYANTSSLCVESCHKSVKWRVSLTELYLLIPARLNFVSAVKCCNEVMAVSLSDRQPPRSRWHRWLSADTWSRPRLVKFSTLFILSTSSWLSTLRHVRALSVNDMLSLKSRYSNLGKCLNMASPWSVILRHDLQRVSCNHKR